MSEMSEIKILDTDMITHSINLEYNQTKYKCFQMIDKDITPEFEKKHQFIKIPVSINADNKLTVNPDKSIEIINSININQNDSIYKAYKQEIHKIKSHQKGVGIINTTGSNCYYSTWFHCISNILPFSYNIIQYNDYYNLYFKSIENSDKNEYLKNVIDTIKSLFRVESSNDTILFNEKEFTDAKCPIQHKGQDGSNEVYTQFLDLLTEYNINNSSKSNDIFKKLQIPFINFLRSKNCLDMKVINQQKYTKDIKYSILEILVFSYYYKNTNISTKKSKICISNTNINSNIFNLPLSLYLPYLQNLNPKSSTDKPDINMNELLEFYVNNLQPPDETQKRSLTNALFDTDSLRELDFRNISELKKQIISFIRTYINNHDVKFNKKTDYNDNLLKYFHLYNDINNMQIILDDTKITLDDDEMFRQFQDIWNFGIPNLDEDYIQPILTNMTGLTDFSKGIELSTILKLYIIKYITIDSIKSTDELKKLQGDFIKEITTLLPDNINHDQFILYYEFRILNNMCTYLKKELKSSIKTILQENITPELNFDEEIKYYIQDINPYEIFEKNNKLYIPRMIVIEINWEDKTKLNPHNHNLTNYNKITIKDTEYILFAVACTDLTIGSGHYVAHKRRFTIGNQQQFDDTKLTQSKDMEFCWHLINDTDVYPKSNKVYVQYNKKNPRPPHQTLIKSGSWISNNFNNYKYSETIKYSPDAGSNLYPELLFYEKIEKNPDGTILNHKLDHGVYYRWAGDYEKTGPVG